jgi:hypothetical protein
MKTEVVKVNGIEIKCPIEGGQSYVAIKPVCEALGIDHSSQEKDLKEDVILGSTLVSIKTNGRDNKQYQMICIPLKFVFRWLFSINENRVKPEAKEHVLKCKIECYNAFLNHFGNIKRQLEVDEIETKLLEKISELNEAKNRTVAELREATAKLYRMRVERLKNEPTSFD